MTFVEDPRVTDNGNGDISVMRGGNRLAGWIYYSEDDRRQMTIYARTYIEGWLDGYHRSRMDLYAARLRERNAQEKEVE